MAHSKKHMMMFFGLKWRWIQILVRKSKGTAFENVKQVRKEEENRYEK